MENKVTEKITRLKYNIDLYKHICNTCNVESNSTKIRLNQIKSKIKYIEVEIRDLINHPSYQVKYQLNDDIHEARLSGITLHDIKVLLNLLADLHDKNLKILEIKEIPNYLIL